MPDVLGRWNSETIIAGVDFSQCKATILDGGRFGSIYAGSSVRAADGTPNVQRVNRGVKGILFGTQMDFAESAALSDMMTAIQAAEAAGQAFRVRQVNALVTIDVWAIPDYSQDPWFVPGAESVGIIEGVTIRFEAMALYAP